ncbi:MAG TPA: hypothetical protein VFE28_16130 [Candidatus Krumholzibacteria bacterium]|nr:hypothetical protein [Candidatus Krumholzibacteria bacterium]
MSPHSVRAVPLALLCLAAIAAAPHHVPGTDADHPRVKYADSLVSLNDRCAVRLNKLNPKIPAVYVNAQPIGFC